MKVLTLVGTRPEYIRLSLIIPKLDEVCDHILVDTAQNYDEALRDVFYKQLNLREPNYKLKMAGRDLGGQLATLFYDLYPILEREKPDAFLVLGDTNSSLGAILAKRFGIRVFHLEAGNRCFDDKVPEEVNRRVIDQCSDVLLPYTERSRLNLLAEGFPVNRVHSIGNPIYEVLNYFKDQVVTPQSPLDLRGYYLVTLHREENVDDPKRLKLFVKAINKLDKPVIWPVHPRTKKRLKGIRIKKHVKLTEPLGLFEFVGLEKNAYCVLTDSGTVQEECAIFAVPVVTLRDTTERPETVEAGCNFISGCEPERILKGVEIVTKNGIRQAPSEYFVENVSDTVVKLVLGYHV